MIKKGHINSPLLLILLLGLMIRVHQLFIKPLWFDELQTAGRITFTLKKIIEYLSASPFPPFYYIVVRAWTDLFGLNAFTLRAPSLICSVLSILFIYKLAKKLFGRDTGLIAAFLLAIWPYSIHYACEAKMYAMLWLFGLLSFYFFYRFLTGFKDRDLILYGLFSTLGIYTLYGGFLFIFVQNIIFFFYDFDKKLLRKWLLVQGLIVLAFSPWFGFLVFNTASRTGIEWIPFNKSCLEFIMSLLSRTLNIFPQTGLGQLTLMGIYSSLFISFVLQLKNDCGQGLKEDIKRKCFILTWVVIPVGLLCLIHVFVMPILVIRYLGFIHIPLIILLSVSLSRYAKFVKHSLLILLLGLFLLCEFFPNQTLGEEFIHRKEDWASFLGNFDPMGRNKNTLVTFIQNPKYKYISRSLPILYPSFKRRMISPESLAKYVAKRKYKTIMLMHYDCGDINPSVLEPGYRLVRKSQEGMLGYYVFKKEPPDKR